MKGIRPSAQSLLEHAEFLRALSRSLLADSASADDVVQDTMLRALERPPARPDNLRGWLGRPGELLGLDDEPAREFTAANRPIALTVSKRDQSA